MRMEPVEPKFESDPLKPRPREQTDMVSEALVKAQLVVGAALGVVAGPLFAHAITARYAPSWWIGGTCLGIGLLLILAGLTSSKRRAQQLLKLQDRSSAAGDAPQARNARRDPTMPMLGALLVYKYGAITEAQLERALAEQRRAGRSRPLLGKVLLDMGLVTDLQLRKALAYQQSRATRMASARPADADDSGT